MVRFLWRVFIASALALSCVSASASTAQAQAASDSFESKAAEAILIDAKSGIVFYEKNADQPIEPASMSKLMTMTLVFEAIKAGTLKPDQEFVISEDAWRRGGAASGGSTMYAVLNSKVKLEDLIRGSIIQSANDACIAIAENMSGSEEAFAARMTARGRELGLKNAVFKNATGLPDPDHMMSVRDLAILARHIILDFPDYYKIYGERSFTWNKITQANRNPLLADYPGADGMKTGYTKSAGYGLVGSAERDGRRLLIVIAGLESLNERKIEAQKLLDWGFRQFKTVSLYEANEVVGKARVWGGDANWVKLVTAQDVKLSLSPREQDKVEIKLVYTGPLMAPLTAGQEVGKLRFMMEGKQLDEVPLRTAAAVAAVDELWSKALDSLMIMTIGG